MRGYDTRRGYRNFITRVVIGVAEGGSYGEDIQNIVYTHDFDELMMAAGIDPIKLKTLALRLMKREGVELDYDEAEEEIIKIWEAI